MVTLVNIPLGKVGIIMSFNITRYTKCVHCNNAYFNKTTVCSHCKGTGYCDVEFVVYEDQPCHTCGGFGIASYRNSPPKEIPLHKTEVEHDEYVSSLLTYKAKCNACFGTGKRYVPIVK